MHFLRRVESSHNENFPRFLSESLWFMGADASRGRRRKSPKMPKSNAPSPCASITDAPPKFYQRQLVEKLKKSEEWSEWELVLLRVVIAKCSDMSAKKRPTLANRVQCVVSVSRKINWPKTNCGVQVCPATDQPTGRTLCVHHKGRSYASWWSETPRPVFLIQFGRPPLVQFVRPLVNFVRPLVQLVRPPPSLTSSISLSLSSTLAMTVVCEQMMIYDEEFFMEHLWNLVTLCVWILVKNIRAC